MKYKKFFLVLVNAALVFPLVFSGLHAQSGIEPYELERVGLSGWQFLKINGDARQAAMAGAFTATSHGDAGAIFGNPSALADVENLDIAFSKVNWIADIGYQSVVVVQSFGNIGVFGFSIVSVDMGEMEETINSPIPGEDRTETVVTGNTFTAGDIAFGLSYAKKITDRLSIGANVRYIREEIAEVSMSNFSIDFGTTYYTGFRSLRLGMVARNFGPDANLVGWSEEYRAEAVDIRMPLDFRVGLAMDFLEGEESPHILTVSIEGTHPNDGPERINMGTEYSFNNIFALRAGYRFNYDEEGFTFGGGLSYGIGSIALRINYAYVDFGRLEQAHMFSLGFLY